MFMNPDILKKLEKLLLYKQSKSFYATKLGISIKEVEEAMEYLRRKKYNDNMSDYITDNQDVLLKTEENIERGTSEINLKTTNEIKSLEELIEKCKIDTNEWAVEKYIQNYWGSEKTPYWQVKAWLKKKTLDNDLVKQKQLILDELKKEFTAVYPLDALNVTGRKLAYELSIPDVHFGQLSWGEETGQDYDLDIAKERFRVAISNLLSYVNLDEIEKIILPIGNDMINIDSRKNQTYSGTPQDSDSRFFKIIKEVKEILIDVINSLSLIAPVHVIVVSGNHDAESMFMMGEILEAYYHNTENVTIDNSPKQRKYIQYGLNGIQYTHGNEEKHSDLGLIFATEESQLWANTKFRFCKLGHYHHNKKIQYLSIDEYQGFQIQILPSLSSIDAWHKSKGYHSMKQAKAFLYDRERGQIGEFTYSV